MTCCRFAAAVAAFSVDEPLGVLSQIIVRVERSFRHLARDVLGDVPGPTLGHVEGDHAERVRILAGQEIADDRFAIGLGGVGFARCRTGRGR